MTIKNVFKLGCLATLGMIILIGCSEEKQTKSHDRIEARYPLAKIGDKVFKSPSFKSACLDLLKASLKSPDGFAIEQLSIIRSSELNPSEYFDQAAAEFRKILDRKKAIERFGSEGWKRYAHVAHIKYVATNSFGARIRDKIFCQSITVSPEAPTNVATVSLAKNPYSHLDL